MLIKTMAGARDNANFVEDVYVTIKNTTGAALSAGYLVCYNVTNAASANGIDVEKPLTSALPAFAGVVANVNQETTYSIADGVYGLAQCYGYNSVAFIRMESTHSAVEGTAYGPVTAQWYAGSNGRSYEFGPVLIMSRLAANTFEGRTKVFIRAL